MQKETKNHSNNISIVSPGMDAKKDDLQNYIDQLMSLNAKITPDGTVLIANAAIVNLCDKPIEEIVSKKLWDNPCWENPEEQEQLKGAVKESAAGNLVRFEIYRYTASGNNIIVDFRLKPIFGEDNKVTYLMVEGYDITDRKRAENALLRSEEKYKELVQNANSIILRWNREGAITFFNEFAQSFFGFTEKEIMGKNVIGTIVPRSDSTGLDLVTMMADICKNPERHETNINENMLKDGTRVWIAWTNKLILNEQGDVTEILSVGVDITERRRIEEEKRLFYSETIKSVTQGKLNLVSSAVVKTYFDSALLSIPIKIAQNTETARQKIIELFQSANQNNADDMALFVTGLGEAMTNALKHASNGIVYAGIDHNCVWAAVTDDGPGIETLTLPKATLRRGYSTKISMGMGYSIMLDSSDKVLLSTGREGTTVVIIKCTDIPTSELSLNDLPDTW